MFPLRKPPFLQNINKNTKKDTCYEYDDFINLHRLLSNERSGNVCCSSAIRFLASENPERALETLTDLGDISFLTHRAHDFNSVSPIRVVLFLLLALISKEKYANANDNRHQRHKKLDVTGVTGSLLNGIEFEVVAWRAIVIQFRTSNSDCFFFFGRGPKS